jgi:SpoVK/Ycf46/Vps4 family AAA+-type ATPase
MDNDQPFRIDIDSSTLAPKGMVRHIKPAATLSRLSVPTESLTKLRRISSDFVPGKSFISLFVGSGGTGKTLAAEAIANELGKDLYRIDLSAVVSKYIGETEKNLQRVFDAAEQSGAVLLFDEADALFGKRTEVKDSHDRYANIEINYLLQRMETYPGLIIVATDKKHVDDAELRRNSRYIVDFPGSKSETICR